MSRHPALVFTLSLAAALPARAQPSPAADGALSPTLDPEFTPRVLAVGPSDDEVAAVAETASGDVVLAGTVWGNDGRSSLFVTRTDEHGRKDRDFGDGGDVLLRPLGVSAGARAVIVSADGGVLVAGYTFREDDSQTDMLLARLLDDGALDESFGDGGYLLLDAGETSDGLNALVEDAAGGVLIAGYRFKELGLEAVVARVHADGALDESFADEGFVVLNVRDDLDELVDIALDDDGRAVAVGRSHIGYSNFSEILAVRLTTAGALDESFADDGIALLEVGPYGFDEGTSLVIDGERIYIGGTVEVGELAGDLDLAIVALDQDGRRDSSVFANGATLFSLTSVADGGDSESLRSLSQTADGTLVFAGHSAHDVIVGAIDADGDLAGPPLRLQVCSAHDRPGALAAGEGTFWLGVLCWQGFEHDVGLARVVVPPAAASDEAGGEDPGLEEYEDHPIFLDEPARDSRSVAPVTATETGCGCAANGAEGDAGLLLSLLVLLRATLWSRSCRRRSLCG